VKFDEKSILTSIEKLKACGTEFQEGLSDREVADLEREFDFVFPHDLRFFLQVAVPFKDYYVPWRGTAEEIARWFARPAEGVLFDVRENKFWFAAWGARPAALDDALQVATEHLAQVPKLIPIGDRLYLKCIPATPGLAENPAFSINQTDILHAGENLADYLRWLSRSREEVEYDEAHDLEATLVFGKHYREIPFWTELARLNAFG
jgi:hypothetical protein